MTAGEPAAAAEQRDETVGVVGLGRIGGAVSACVANAGWPVRAYDVRADAIEGHPELDGLEDSPATLARSSSLVLVAVLDEPQLREVLAGPGGLLEGAHDRLVIAVLSTVSLPAIHECAALAAGAGATLVDCGVTGGGASSPGQLVSMVGGPPAVVTRITPVLQAFSKRVLHMGPLGCGMQAKLARNLLTYGVWMVADEAARLADQAGVDREQFVEAIRESEPNVAPSWVWLAEQPSAVADDDAARRETVAGLMRKDLAAAEQLGGAIGVETPIARLTRAAADRIVGRRRDDAEAQPDALPSLAELRELGAATMEQVYGFSVDEERLDASLIARYTLEHLFPRVWARPELSIRDRRLLTMGAVAALGCGELWELQLRQALRNGEVTVEQMQEMVLHMAHYIGWPRSIAIEQAVQRVIADPDATPQPVADRAAPRAGER
jgi:3-hydroxyisobutyrate dehydrogenase-like beta-hydroxyacid dehydrogenase